MATSAEIEKFTSELMKEVKELEWEIKDFGLSISTLKDIDELKMDFKAGKSIGLPTKWQFYFEKDGNQLGLYMKLLDSPYEATRIVANFRYEIIREPYQFPADGWKISPRSCKYIDKGLCYPSFIESMEDFKSQISSHPFLVNGHLKIRLQFVLYNRLPSTPDPIRSELATLQYDSCLAMTQGFQKLLDSGTKADLTIQMKDGRTLKAHSAFLLAQSRIFSAMLETDMTEASSGVILVEDLSYEVMSKILHFLYTGKLEDGWEEHLNEIIYGADKYELFLLKNFCDKALGSTCRLDNAWHLLDFAESHSLEVALKQISDYIKANIGGLIQVARTQPQAKRIKLEFDDDDEEREREEQFKS